MTWRWSVSDLNVESESCQPPLLWITNLFPIICRAWIFPTDWVYQNKGWAVQNGACMVMHSGVDSGSACALCSSSLYVERKHATSWKLCRILPSGVGQECRMCRNTHVMFFSPKWEEVLCRSGLIRSRMMIVPGQKASPRDVRVGRKVLLIWQRSLGLIMSLLPQIL